MLKIGNFYVPMYNIREIYFSKGDKSTVNVVRNTFENGVVDSEEYDLDPVQAKLLEAEMKHLSDKRGRR